MSRAVYLAHVTTADLPADDTWLSLEEAALLQTMRFPRRRADWRLGRWAAKQAVSWGWGTPALEPAASLRDITIAAASDGAPEAFLNGDRIPLRISISHRGGAAICAAAEGYRSLGCDLELVEPRSAAFVRDFFTDDEHHLVETASPRERSVLTAVLWSAKESALKAVRSGLRADTRSAEVYLSSWPPREPPPDGEWLGAEIHWAPFLVRHAASGQVFGGWWRRRDLDVITIVADPPPAPPSLVRARVPAPAGQA